MRAAQPEPGRGERACSPTTTTRSVRRSATSTPCVGEVASFVADNREALGTTSDKVAGDLAGVGGQPRRHQADAAHRADRVPELHQHLPTRAGLADRRAGDEQLLQPDRSSCAAQSRRPRGSDAEQSAKLCVQYLAPIVKNRQYNFLPLGLNPIVGAPGPPQRGDLQRGLDAARLRSARSAPPHRPRPRRRMLHRACRGRRCRPGPAAARRTNPTDGLHGHDGPAGRRIVTRTSAARVWRCCCALVGIGTVRLRLAGRELAAAAGHRGRRPGCLRGPGPAARRAQHPAEFARSRRRRHRRHRHKIERQGWHALVTMTSQRQRRAAGQRHRQHRADQPAGHHAHRTGAADRLAAGGQAA